MTTHHDIWHAYASAWSAPLPQRDDLLDRHVRADVAYRDPTTEVLGRAALSDYMHAFQQGFPGYRFAITVVEAHHDRSLAHWQLRDSDDTPVQDGISHAVHDTAHRLTDITGFFPVQAPAERVAG
jgi:SnoaL-like protein